jgi:hypothetical protein
MEGRQNKTTAQNIHQKVGAIYIIFFFSLYSLKLSLSLFLMVSVGRIVYSVDKYSGPYGCVGAGLVWCVFVFLLPFD